jgi:hypothetical protein
MAPSQIHAMQPQQGFAGANGMMPNGGVSAGQQAGMLMQNTSAPVGGIHLQRDAGVAFAHAPAAGFMQQQQQHVQLAQHLLLQQQRFSTPGFAQDGLNMGMEEDVVQDVLQTYGQGMDSFL